MFLARTFSQIKHSRLKQLAQVQKIISNNFATTTVSHPPGDEFDHITDENSLIEVLGDWKEQDQGLLEDVLSTMRVLPGFLAESEEAAMLAELEPKLRRMRYEFDHWDDAIHGYRETEVGSWGEAGAAVMSRVAALAFPARGVVVGARGVGGEGGSAPQGTAPRDTKLSSIPELRPVSRGGDTRAPATGTGRAAPPATGTGRARPLRAQHVLDLAPAGHIKPHIDAVRFCGEVIAGLCLCSSAVMVLEHEVRKELKVRALLPRRCLYIMSGVSRYAFSHAIPTGKESMWRGKLVPKKRRVAIITRSEPKPEHITPATIPGEDFARYGGNILKRETHITPIGIVQPTGDLGKIQGETPKAQGEPVQMQGDSTEGQEEAFKTLGDSAKFKGDETKIDPVVKAMSGSDEVMKKDDKPNPPKDAPV